MRKANKLNIAIRLVLNVIAAMILVVATLIGVSLLYNYNSIMMMILALCITAIYVINALDVYIERLTK